MKNRRRTQADVAKLAGVSQAAVSQALNCNDSTRQRKLDAIDRFGYVPNTLTQSFEPLLQTYLSKFREWFIVMKNNQLEQANSYVFVMR